MARYSVGLIMASVVVSACVSKPRILDIPGVPMTGGDLSVGPVVAKDPQDRLVQVIDFGAGGQLHIFCREQSRFCGTPYRYALRRPSGAVDDLIVDAVASVRSELNVPSVSLPAQSRLYRAQPVESRMAQVRDLYKALASADRVALAALVADDVTLRGHRRGEASGGLLGNYFRIQAFKRRHPGAQFEAQELLSAGDYVLARGVLKAGPSCVTCAPREIPTSDLVHFDARGKVISVDVLQLDL